MKLTHRPRHFYSFMTVGLSKKFQFFPLIAPHNCYWIRIDKFQYRWIVMWQHFFSLQSVDHLARFHWTFEQCWVSNWIPQHKIRYTKMEEKETRKILSPSFQFDTSGKKARAFLIAMAAIQFVDLCMWKNWFVAADNKSQTDPIVLFFIFLLFWQRIAVLRGPQHTSRSNRAHTAAFVQCWGWSWKHFCFMYFIDRSSDIIIETRKIMPLAPFHSSIAAVLHIGPHSFVWPLSLVGAYRNLMEKTNSEALAVRRSD